VLDQPDTNYWTTTGYRIPDTPHATIRPDETDVKLVSITGNVPRSFLTNIHSGDAVHAGTPMSARGIAFGGDSGVARVDLSIDDGKNWLATQLGKDEGKYGFRQWLTQFTLSSPGRHSLVVRCTNSNGVAQPSTPVWNAGGYMRNTIESIDVVAA
jgi:hypothetical protein